MSVRKIKNKGRDKKEMNEDKNPGRQWMQHREKK